MTSYLTFISCCHCCRNRRNAQFIVFVFVLHFTFSHVKHTWHIWILIMLPSNKQHVAGNKQLVARNLLRWCKRGITGHCLGRTGQGRSSRRSEDHVRRNDHRTGAWLESANSTIIANSYKSTLIGRHATQHAFSYAAFQNFVFLQTFAITLWRRPVAASPFLWWLGL